MNIEQIIKKISALAASLVIFFMASGMYLSFKGFNFNDKGELVLMRQAYAQDYSAPQALKLPSTYVMPNAHVIGDPQAPITIYEYSSFGCFHCADFHLQTLPKLKQEFIDNGSVRLVFVSFPIDRTSMNAALLAECMPADKYFAFADLLFKKQREWGMARDPEKVLLQYAALSGLGSEKAKACLKNDEMAREILENRQNGMTQIGIQGTPSFVIRSADGFELLQGAQSTDNFRKLLMEKTTKK